MPRQPKKGKNLDDLPEPEFSSFHQSLLDWYRKEGRNLPWRQTQDPYKIWVSEVMLQQTQVATVIPYYYRFIKALPTVQALAQAPLQKVLKLWEGLGYYARARNLHRGANKVVKEWKGQIPSDPVLLQTLPGIGQSTAGAIVCFAFGRRAPILDGNLRRAFARILAIRSPLNRTGIQKRLWRFSEQILPTTHPAAEFNQALMDLGATVCTPRKPSCMLCPVRGHCSSFRSGIQDRIPSSPRRKALPQRHVIAAIIIRGDSVLITRREERGLLGGLWGFAEIPGTGKDSPHKITQTLLDQYGMRVKITQGLPPVEHTFTHFKMTYYPLIAQYIAGAPKGDIVSCWISPSNLQDFPFPSAMHKILRLFFKITHSYTESNHQVPLAAEQTDHLTYIHS